MVNTIEILKEIIAIPSYVDATNNESALIDYIVDFVKKYQPNLTIEKQAVEASRYNIIIKDSREPKTILFGHLDTVLPKAETAKPFSPKIDGDKFYGLGAVDMKFGIAIMLDILRNNHKPTTAYIFTVDEEYEFKGALKLAEGFSLKPDLIINVEPTSFKILNGCRGITEFSFVVHGKSVHAGLKQLGINAIEKGVQLVDLLQQSISKFDTPDGGNSTLNLAYMHGGVFKEIDNQGNPILSDLGMVVPNYAKLNCEIRIASKLITEEYVTSELNKIAEELGVTISDLHFKFYLGSMLTPKDKLKQFEKAILATGEAVNYGEISKAGYYEVQMLQEKTGCDCVVFGASPIEMSHCVDEYVEISTVEKTQKVIEKYLASI